MKRVINILSVVLGAQLLLAALLLTSTTGISGVGSGEPLVKLDTQAVDHLTIDQSGKDDLVLVRKDDKWEIPALGDFPASKIKVEALIDKLAAQRKRIPVATSTAAAKRFKVSPDAYQHKLVLASGEKTLATLWLGDSQNFRRVYARVDGEDPIYELDLAAYETNADTDAWTDKDYLHLKPEDITAVTLPAVKLQRKDDKWQAEGLAEGEQTNTEEADTLVRKLANLSYLSVLGKDEKPEYKQDTPAVTVKLTTKSGERSYVISKPDKGADYVLKSSTSPYYFKVADFAVKDLVEAKREKVVKGAEGKKEEEKAAAPSPATMETATGVQPAAVQAPESAAAPAKMPATPPAATAEANQAQPAAGGETPGGMSAPPPSGSAPPAAQARPAPAPEPAGEAQKPAEAPMPAPATSVPSAPAPAAAPSTPQQ